MAAGLKVLLSRLIASITSGLGGALGVVAKYILNYGGQVILDALADWQKKKEREAAQKKAADAYMEVQKKPNSTVEERAKAYENYVNAGR